MALVLVNVATLHKETEVHAHRLNSCGLRTYWQKYGVSSTCLGVLYWQFFLLTGPTIFLFLTFIPCFVFYYPYFSFFCNSVFYSYFILCLLCLIIALITSIILHLSYFNILFPILFSLLLFLLLLFMLYTTASVV
jgi:hypothetical protein